MRIEVCRRRHEQEWHVRHTYLLRHGPGIFCFLLLMSEATWLCAVELRMKAKPKALILCNTEMTVPYEARKQKYLC